jgi:hypothetical protein
MAMRQRRNAVCSSGGVPDYVRSYWDDLDSSVCSTSPFCGAYSTSATLSFSSRWDDVSRVCGHNDVALGVVPEARPNVPPPAPRIVAPEIPVAQPSLSLKIEPTLVTLTTSKFATTLPG